MRGPEQRVRQRGQIALMLAIAFPLLLGVVGIGVDLGFGYAHRRQVQNAADAAALAGAQALGRHYTAMTIGSGYTGTLVDYTDAMILTEITTAAAANVSPFPDPATAPPWPTGTDNSLTAYYLLTDSAGTMTVGTQVGQSGIPAAAAGVRVEARLSSPSLFARIMGACCETVSSGASARALLRPLGSTDAGPPFIVCGGGPNAGSDGAWIVASSTPSHIGTQRQILDFSTTPARVDASFVGDTLQVHDSQLGQNHADCGAGNSYKGNENPNDTCDPTGSAVLPCRLQGQTGTRAGPVRNRVAGLPGCAPNSPDGTTCVVVLAIADSYQSGEFRVVAWAPFLITQSSANSHSAVLLGAAMTEGQASELPFVPTAPGAFTVKLGPDT